MKISNGIFVTSLTMTEMLDTIELAFFSINSSKKYPFLVPLVRAWNVVFRNSSIKQVDLASTMKDAAPSGSVYRNEIMIHCETVIVIYCFNIFVCETFVVNSRYSVADGDNTGIEYEMTILCPCKPIAVRHQWNRILSGYWLWWIDPDEHLVSLTWR